MFKKLHVFLYFFGGFILAQNSQNSWVEQVPVHSILFEKSTPEITDISKNPFNNLEWIVATNNAGLWVTQNNGTTYMPIVSSEIPSKIWKIAVDWNSKNIWISTQKGIFFSENKGEKWQKISVDIPNISQILLLSSSEILISSSQKGIFRSQDKGKSWTHIFSEMGVEQMVVNSENIYISAVQNSENENQSAIYKSNDKGEKWLNISVEKFPKAIGKILLATTNSGTLWALINDKSHTEISNFVQEIEKMTSEEIINLPDVILEKYIAKYGFDFKFSAGQFREILRANEQKKSLKELFNFQTISVGARLFEITNQGRVWHEKKLPEDIFYGKELMGLNVNAFNENELFLLGDKLLFSKDRGNSWEMIKNADFSAEKAFLKYDENTLFYATNSQFFVSFDKGNAWAKQYFKTGANVYSLAFNQENKTLFASFPSEGIFKKETESWEKIISENGKITFGQTGKMFISTQTGKCFVIDGKTTQEIALPFADEHLRFSKEIPMVVSPQNKNILYAGSNVLLQSFNAGGNWNLISKEVTNGNKNEKIAFPTISAIAESPFQFGLLYTGSDDGMIYQSTNSGVSWQLLYSAFPQKNKVIQLVASQHEKNRIYALLKSENDIPLVFKSDDMGNQWFDLKANLPNENVTTLLEDAFNHQVLYLGTQTGVYVSFDQGEKWHRFEKMPVVEVSQMTMDTQNKTLYIGTKGKGIFSINVSALQELKAAVQDQFFYPLAQKYTLKHSLFWGKTLSAWDTPQEPVVYFNGFASTANKSVKITIKYKNIVLNSFSYLLKEGFNFIPFNVTATEQGRVAHEKALHRVVYSQHNKNYLPKGSYIVHFQGEMIDEERELEIQ